MRIDTPVVTLPSAPLNRPWVGDRPGGGAVAVITESLRRHLGIEDEEEDTDARRLFTIEKVPCLGCCSLAPCMTVDGVTYGRLTPHSACLTIERIAKESD